MNSAGPDRHIVSAGGFDAPRFPHPSVAARQSYSNTEATTTPAIPGFGSTPQSPSPTAAEISILGCLFVASVLFAGIVAIAADSARVVSGAPAASAYPVYWESTRPEFVICEFVKLECVKMYFDNSRPEVETLIAVRSLPRVITMDLRFRQDESGNLILRIYDDNLDHPWRDARLSDLTAPHFDNGTAKQRAYRGSWTAGTNFNSRLIGQYAGEQRKVVAELDRPRQHDLTQPVRANFFVTAALPTLTDAPLLDLMELPGDTMDRQQQIFARNHRIRQGQSL